MLFLVVAVRLGVTWSLIPELAFTAGLIALAAVDLERYLLPKAIVYPVSILVMAGVALAAAEQGRWTRLGIAVLCAVAAFGIFFAINFVKPAWMGFGDVRLAGLIGLALGWLGPWYVVIGFMAANVAGALLGVGLMLSGKATRKTALPYGVFLAGGSVIAILVGGPIINWYSHLVVR